MNQSKLYYIIILSLLFSIAAITIGYATLSNNVTIKSSASVVPNFAVSLSKAASSASTGNVSGTVSPSSGGPTAGTATLNATTISGLKGTFTANGTAQSVKYSFYARNTGAVTGYLNTVNIGAISCSAGSPNPASATYITATCNGITVTVKVGTATYSRTTASNGSNASISSHTLAASGNEAVEVTIALAAGDQYRPDGDVNVTIGDTTLIYAPID